MVIIVSQNVRSIGEYVKRKEVFYHLRQRADIVCIQETHSSKETEQIWQHMWKGNTFWSHGKSNARGVGILLKNNIDITVKASSHDDTGRYVIIQYEHRSQLFVLVNIYAPNEDKPNFFLEVFKKLENYEGKRILVGDFNLALDPKIDRNNENSKNNEKSAQTLNQYMTETLLVDIWRERNAEKKHYTFRQF